MPHQPKIATCCYCGTRAALVLDRGRHELSCASCGAPLHELKMLRTDRSRRVKHAGSAPSPVRSSRPRRTKKRKSLTRKLFSELIDEVEDIFDIFD